MMVFSISYDNYPPLPPCYNYSKRSTKKCLQLAICRSLKVNYVYLLDHNVLERVESINDLGVTVSLNLSWSKNINLFTTIHDGNFRRHSSMNVTIKLHKFSSNIYYIYVFFVI